MKLQEVRRFALRLSQVTEEPHFEFSSFRVGGRIFVTVPPDEEHIHVFVTEPVRNEALSRFPAFMEKLLWGGKVRGVRVTLAPAEPGPVRALIRSAWESKAPAALKPETKPRVRSGPRSR